MYFYKACDNCIEWQTSFFTENVWVIMKTILFLNPIRLNYGLLRNDYRNIFFWCIFINMFSIGITKGFKAKRCGSFSEMKENECKDVVQRKNHAVEILEVKEILSLKKDMHQTFVLIHEKYIIFIYCFQHIFTFVSLF